MLRRVVRNLRLLGADGPALTTLVARSCVEMGESYPELLTDQVRIEAVAAQEEESFLATLRTGSSLFDRVVDDVKASGASTVPGDQAFALHDTYGFPIDLTLEMAREQGLEVDENGFRRLMQEQRDKAKADAASKKTGHADLGVYRSLLDSAGTTTFTGYVEVASEATLRGLLVEGIAVDVATEGADVEIALDRTPFYAEAGGQLADHGRITLGNGAVIEVHDAQKPLADLVIHR